MADTKTINQTRVRIVKGDITDLEVEAFVYYARNDLDLGSGYGNAISMRGGPTVKAEVKKLGPIDTGKAVVSGAGEMKAKKIVHAVGPKFQEKNTEGKLQETMKSALAAADSAGIQQLAFPAMGAGFYGIPLEVCSKLMLESLQVYLKGKTNLREVIIVLGSNRDYQPFAAALDKLKPEVH